MESVFEVIAEPNRRAILSLLASSEQSVGEIERQLRMSQPTVSKHLRVLRDAGIVRVQPQAQQRVYELEPRAFKELATWVSTFRRIWEQRLDSLEDYLQEVKGTQGRRPRTR